MPATFLGSLAGFIFYVRSWIQGYYFDKQCALNVDLTGRCAVVTGGTVGGLGFAAAEILAAMGATVIITVRNEVKGKDAVARLARASGHDRISFVLVDFLSKSSIRDGTASILKAHSRLDILVLNAGVSGGADLWMANQVGPFLFTKLLTPLLVSTSKMYGDVRVVAVSSGAHKNAVPYDPTDDGSSHVGSFTGSYGQSKLAQIMHMRELQRRLRAQPGLEGEQAVRCVSVTPGFALTNIVSGKIPAPARPLVWLLARSPHVGAQVIKMACIDAAVPGGAYLSNCGVKSTEGANGCSNDPEEWSKLWALCETSVKDEHYQ